MRAYIVFIDESGLLMAPVVRRTWSPCGTTPIVSQRTRSHKKVSAIAALCLSPDRKHVNLYFRLLPDKNFNAYNVRGFLYHLNRHLNAPAVIIWDRFLPHRAKKLREYCKETKKFHVCFFPSYAPELNPVEYLWSWLKTNPLANFAPDNLDELSKKARKEGRAAQHKQGLLRSFINHCPLSLRLK